MSRAARIWMAGALGGALAALALTLTAPAEIAREKLYTHPVPPPREVLDPLNLTLHWRAYAAVDGRRDGIDSIQLAGPDLLIHTRSGMVIAMDAETGQTRWRTSVGVPYRGRHLLGFNSRYVFPVNNNFLHCVDRHDGTVKWRYKLVGATSAPPVADEEQVYIVRPDGRVYAYFIPRLEIPFATPVGSPKDRPLDQLAPDELSPLYQGVLRTTTSVGPQTNIREMGVEAEKGPKPAPSWDFATGWRILQPPVLTDEAIMLSDPDGRLMALSKRGRADGSTVEVFNFAVDGAVMVRTGYLDNTAYVGSQDTNLYAIAVSTGKIIWRHTAGHPISRSPLVTADDVFVTATDQGLSRLQRANGEPMWRVPLNQGRGRRVVAESNAEADQPLAANPKFVYAFDRQGRLLVLDYRRGVTLARLDTRQFVVPVANEYTDRLYLAANNGLIVCLRDREYTEPIRHRRPAEGGSEMVREKLAQAITAQAVDKALPLREVLEGFRANYGLRFFIDLDEFKKAGIDNPDGKGVVVPRAQNTPLADILKQVLAQAQATYKIVDDVILIVPLPKKEK
jgi:outer membrane protein assembly factor BamB